MAQYELNLHDYLRILKRRRWVIIFTTFAIIGSVAVFTNLQTPIYEASATIKVEPLLTIPGVSSYDQGGWDTYTALNTEVKIIRSTIVSARTARKLGILTDDLNEEQKQSVISYVQSKISAERVGETNLIIVGATSSEAEETARLANATAEVYIEKGMEDRSRRARDLRQFIEGQLKESEDKLRKAEDNLKRFTEKSGVKGIGGFLTNQLIDLQNRKNLYLKKYTNQHPDVQRINQQIVQIEQSMKNLPAEELEFARFSREISINEELYTLLSKRFKESQISEADRVQSAFVVTPAIVPASPIKPNRMMNMLTGSFLGVFFGFLLALVIENFDTSIGTIEDVEKFLSLPVLGIIPHIEAEDKRKSFWPFKPKQKYRSEIQRSKLIVYHPTKSPFAEAYHTLRTNLKFLLPRGKGNVIAFSSAGISEGKTLSASNFSLAAAQSGIKTLLVEIDLRLPSLHKLFGLNRDPGISDCLLGTKKWQDVLRGTTDFIMSELTMDKILHSPGIENLRIITAGPIPPNPIDLINSSDMSTMFAEMSSQFDLVVLDCPPILLFADTLIVGTFTSGTILVYRVGKMARTALKRAKDQLTNVNIPVLGVVLNDITSSDMEPHYYGYYYSKNYYSKGKGS